MGQLDVFFNPDGIVVIGASTQKEKLGYGVARNLINSGYKGKIAFMNPKRGILFDLPIHQSISEIGEEIDLGVIVVPPAFVPETLTACARQGIKHVVIVTGGFSEAGEEGAKLEQACKRIAKKEGMRVIGPNCIGMIDTHLPMDTTFIQPPMPEAGEIAFITHSGALGAAMIDWARGEGFGFSRLVSLGNQMDVNETDMLVPFAEDAHTKVVTMYLEGIQDGEAFIRQAKKAAKLKPLIAVKVGRSTAGQQAAASHTGALAGEDRAFDAAFRRAGVHRARTAEEMFQWAKMFAWCELPKGKRVAVLTNAGGPGVMAADAVAYHGLQMAELSAETMGELTNRLPNGASVHNPVDMLASASPKDYAGCLQILAKDENVDMVMVIAPPPPMFTALATAEALTAVIAAIGKPVAVSFMGSRLVEDARQYLRQQHIPEFRFPEDGMAALAMLWQEGENKKRDMEELGCQVDEGAKKLAAKAVEMRLENQSGGFVPPQITGEILSAYGLPIEKLHLAASMQEASSLADQLGYPLVMKLAADDLSHKSDVGGILLNLQSRKMVEQGYQTLMTKGRELPGVKGVYLQRMAKKGQEVIVGGVRDAVFGPMLLFGSGGVDVEGLGDVGFCMAPFTRNDFDDLLANTWAGRKLAGFRQYAPADKEAVYKALVCLGQLMLDTPEIQEVELNPMIVFEAGKGASGVDARMMIGRK